MKRRIEEKTSRTASMTCSCRAASYYEKDPCYRSADHVATLLVPWFVRYMSRISLLRKLFMDRFAPKGVYEYVIARTKYIDHVFTKTVQQGVEQVLILGAGFDTRSMRLLPPDSAVKVFEVDAEITQRAKLGRLREIGLPIPENTTYVAIDFNKEDPMERLMENAFQVGRPCLFILEGLLMYLSDDAVDGTFHLIHDLSGEGSHVVFDYIYSSVLDHEERYFGERELLKNVRDAGEPWTFGLDEGRVGGYLLERGFRVKEECNTEILEERYFTGEDGVLQGRINGTHSIVLAEPI